MGPKSLKNALLLVTAILIVTSGIVISQIVIHRYSRSLIKEAAARAETIAHKLALDAADKILINDLVALQKLLDDQMRSDTSVAYLFIVRNGHILTHTFKKGVPVDLVAANTASTGDSGSLRKIVSAQADRFLDVAWPIFGGKAGVLRLGFSEKLFRQQAAQLWKQMSLVTVAVLLLALFVGHFFISRLTRPLHTLTAAAETIDEVSLETRVQVNGRMEVRQLAAAFNAMLTRLNDYTDRLRNANRRLEGKNEELDRVHRQLRISFAISQEIAALPNLHEVSTYLLKTLSKIAACRHMAMLVFGNRGDESFVWFENEARTLAKEDSEGVRAAFRHLNAMTFMEKESLGILPFCDNLQSATRLAVFPLRHEGRLAGAVLIGCPGDCNCVKKELGVIALILKQTASTLQRALVQEEEIKKLRSRIGSTAEFHGLVGRDPKMQLIYKLIEDVAPTDTTVLIQGESGTGKELVARAIHCLSTRREHPFVVINCSAYPSTLLESELFGHEKGAFTGALRRKVGRFEQAHGGTVFLDEIGEISPSAQIRLLRVIQSRTFERIGGEEAVNVDVRILAATNKKLMEEVKKGTFREDLFYRLNVIPVQMPPLRERRNDIPLLARHFLEQYATEQKKPVQGFTSEAMRVLLDYRWPGNVRELENSVEHAVVLARENQIDVTDLPPVFVEAPALQPPPRSILANEATLIREVLDECQWNKKQAALRLGISRSTLYGKLRKYKISKPTLH